MKIIYTKVKKNGTNGQNRYCKNTIIFDKLMFFGVEMNFIIDKRFDLRFTNISSINLVLNSIFFIFLNFVLKC